MEEVDMNFFRKILGYVSGSEVQRSKVADLSRWAAPTPASAPDPHPLSSTVRERGLQTQRYGRPRHILGVRFDIEKLGRDSYGFSAWKVFWGAVEPEMIVASCLFEGDTDATLKGREKVYSIALECPHLQFIEKIKTVLDSNQKFLHVAAMPRFVEDDACVGEPLSDAGYIDTMKRDAVSEASHDCGASLESLRRERAAPERGIIKIQRRYPGRDNSAGPLRIEAERLRGADLHGRDLSNGVFDGLDLSGANLVGCSLMDSSFKNADLQGANLSQVITQKEAYVQGVSFDGTNLANAKIIGTKLQYTSFDSANLENADFANSVLDNCSFRYAKLKNTDFSDADLTNSTFARVSDPLRYIAATRWPPRFSPSDIGKPGFEGRCPRCGTPCRLEPAPFSPYVQLYRCPQRHFVGVQCPACHKDVLRWVGDMNHTVHTECPGCTHSSTGIPKDWWHRNIGWQS
jgi:hypothetical protein